MSGIAFVLILTSALAAWAQPRRELPAPIWRPGVESDKKFSGQYVFLSEDLSEIIIRLPGDSSGKLIRAKFDNNIQPSVKAAAALQAGGQHLYTYRVFNGLTANRPITVFSIVAPDGLERPPVRFGRWRGPSLSMGAPIAKQTLLPGVEAGRRMSWYYHADSGGKPIAPGTSTDDFVMTSSYRPGYTTAYLTTWDAVKWPPMDPDAVWPDIVATQTQPVLSMEWLDKQVLTVGSMFSPDEKPHPIAQHLMLAIQQLGLMSEVDINSPFLKEVQEVLTAVVAQKDVTDASLQNAPSSDRERELAEVVRLSLRVQVPR